MGNIDRTILERKLTRLAIFLFFLVVFFSFVYPVSDPDTPWHLKTGQYILMNRTIPMSSDPFSFAKEKIPFVGRFILSQNWIAQVLLFSIYKSLGTLGLVLTRAVVFTLIIAIIWYLINRRKRAFIAVLSAGAVAFVTHTTFSGIRPQIFTFLFSALVILLFEKYRDTRSVKWLFPLPLLMLLWANMHGGFIYGIVLIFIYLFGASAEFLLKGRAASCGKNCLSSRQFTLLVVFSLLSVLFAMINPNTYKAFVYTFMTHWPDYKLHKLYSEIIENKTPYTLIQSNSILFGYFSAFVALAFVMALAFIRRRQWTQLFLVLFAVIPALVAIRYIPLFLIVATPLIAHMPSVNIRKSPASSLRIGLWVTLIFFFSFVGIFSNPFRSRDILRFNQSYIYPVRATDFLLNNGIRGNIFASYNTAAFILFKCYPGSRIYLDSSFVDVTRIIKGLEIEGAFDTTKEKLASINRLIPPGVGSIKIAGPGGKGGGDASRNDAEWEKLLDRINADIIVYGAVNQFSESIVPFVFRLANDKTWKLIFSDGTVMIFVRNEPKFKNIIARYQLPKSRIYDEILEECFRRGPEGKRYYSSIALALLLKGIATQKTSFFIDKALARDPKDSIAIYSQVLFTLMTHDKKIRTVTTETRRP